LCALCAFFALFFEGYVTRQSLYGDCTARQPSIRIRSMLRQPLSRLPRIFFRTTESPIAGPARFPDLVSLVRLIRTFLQRDQHGKRSAGWRHLNQLRWLIALTALLAHFLSLFSRAKARKPSMPPIKALMAQKAQTFPRHSWAFGTQRWRDAG
jgi:hypothetical protein